jgi:hypothetical protein
MERLEKRLLRQIIGIGFVAGKQSRVPRHLRQPTKRDLLKVCVRWRLRALGEFHGQRRTLGSRE